jgi:acylpyruvate hydrolase
MTARNLQTKAKEKGLPWTQAKGYDTFCPIAGQVIPKEKIPDPHNIELWLKVDGTIKQKGKTNQMIFK